MTDLEKYREVARSIRGTQACAAILGLINIVERLEGDINEYARRLNEARAKVSELAIKLNEGKSK